MKASWGAQITQLETAMENFITAMPTLPADIPYQGTLMPIEDLLKSLTELIKQMKAATMNDVDAVLYSVHAPGVISQVPNLYNAIQAFVAQGGAAPSGDAFISQIWSIYSSLSYVTPSDRVFKSPLQFFSKESKAQLTELDKLNKILVKAYDLVNTHEATLEKTKDKINGLLIKIEKDALEASNAKTNAESNVVQSATSKEKIDQFLIDFAAGQIESDKLLSELTKIKDKAEKTLASTSQVALAKSFNTRKTSLELSQTFWIKAFSLGLICLFAFTIISIAFSDFYHLPPIISNKTFDAWGVLLRILLASPIVWFTWFSVRQYGNNVTLIEDYAFKEASALAFVGYKKDMEDDIDMVKLLRESAIRNFAYPPSRLISPSEATSPMHDLFEKAFQDKGAFDKLIEMLKAMRPTRD